jgi:hypothetical protein
METSDVRRHVVETIERAKRRVQERRVRAEEATRAYERFLETTAVPLFRQIANALRAHAHPFGISTPSGSVALISERAGDDSIAIALDTSDDEPAVVIRSRRGRGRRVIEAERRLAEPERLTEEDLVAAVMKELEPMVER